MDLFHATLDIDHQLSYNGGRCIFLVNLIWFHLAYNRKVFVKL